MSQEITSSFCPTCNATTRHSRELRALGCGDLVMVICTFGLWLVVRQAFRGPFFCDFCGRKHTRAVYNDDSFVPCEIVRSEKR